MIFYRLENSTRGKIKKSCNYAKTVWPNGKLQKSYFRMLTYSYWYN